MAISRSSISMQISKAPMKNTKKKKTKKLVKKKRTSYGSK